MGAVCDCAEYEPPAKRQRGRSLQFVAGCRRCWRSLTTDRELMSPHGLSLASRCVEDHPDLTRHVVVEALKLVLPRAGFCIRRQTMALTLCDGSRSPKLFGWVVLGWRDQRMDCTFVQCSTVPSAGAGLFAAVTLLRDTYLHKYEGHQVKAHEMRRAGYSTGYLMRIGPHYIDARDPLGRLRLSDGELVDVHSFTQDEWVNLSKRGVAWEGAANLSRFVNHATTPNARYHRGWLVTTRDVRAGAEIFVRYGKGFWSE